MKNKQNEIWNKIKNRPKKIYLPATHTKCSGSTAILPVCFVVLPRRRLHPIDDPCREDKVHSCLRLFHCWDQLYVSVVVMIVRCRIGHWRLRGGRNCAVDGRNRRVRRISVCVNQIISKKNRILAKILLKSQKQSWFFQRAFGVKLSKAWLFLFPQRTRKHFVAVFFLSKCIKFCR